MKCYKHNQIQVRRKNKRSKSIHKDQRNSQRKSKYIRQVHSFLCSLRFTFVGIIYANPNFKWWNLW